ncbi:type II 3-dehydroquinate dehydratase [Oceaniglobus trochenteri]|uniref:type II 3-dehydroquinate dehydratase n=1 Tax=Oceaniglobus trochenteri TaxID=2763260 RepID=UPI001D00178E|nr:type II 3-dehydroquinate dehydratase [Oceaniglobus trochenteri]
MSHTFNITRSGNRKHKIAVIDGPNMTSLGNRSKQVYGTIASLKDLQDFVTGFGNDLGVEIETFASNYQGAILEFIHESAHRVDGYIINPAGATTIGEAIRHALQDSERPVIEVHFANISAEPAMPRGLNSGKLISTFTHSATGMCMGMRQYSYSGALLAMVQALDDATFLGAQD